MSALCDLGKDLVCDRLDLSSELIEGYNKSFLVGVAADKAERIAKLPQTELIF